MTDVSMRLASLLGPTRPTDADPLEGHIARARVTGALFPSMRKPGSTFAGRYTLRRVLGRGAFGMVVEAVDDRLQRAVAIKLLPRASEEDRARLTRESRALAAVDHPGIVAIFDAGVYEPGDLMHGLATDEDPPRAGAYIVMELIDGRTLASWLDDQEPSLERTIGVFSMAGRGLAAAHAQGVVHRDFKPSNVMIDASGRARVVDFGLACGAFGGGLAKPLQRVRTVASDDPISDELAVSSFRTQSGLCFGTPAYMPPEQIAGRDVDARADQFSFCVALWEALVGERPFPGQPLASRILAIRQPIQIPPVDAARARLLQVIARGLRERPEDRFGSMDALLRALRGAMHSRRPRRIFGFAALAGVGAAVAWSLAAAPGQHRATDARSAAASELAAPDADTEALTRQVAKAEGLLDDGKERDALRLFEGALAHDSARVPPALATRMHIGAGRAHARLGDFPSASRRLSQAWELAIVADLDVEAVRAGTRLVLTVGVGLGQPAQGLQWARHTVTRMERMGSDPNRDAAFLLHRALVREAAGKPAEARTDLARAVALVTPPQTDVVTRARVSIAKANVLLSEGRLAEGRELHRDAAQQLEAALGPSNVRVAAQFANLARVASSAEESARWMERSLAIFAREAPLHPTHATVLVVHSQQLVRRDRLGEAREALTRAFAIQTQVMDQTDVRLAETLTTLGFVTLQSGAPKDARDAFAEALRIRQLTLSADDPRVAAAWSNLGIASRIEGDYQRAREALEAAVAAWDRGPSPNAPGARDAMTALGTLARAEQRLGVAERLQTRALSLERASPDPNRSRIATAHAELATTLMAAGRLPEAQRHAEQALALRIAVAAPHHQGVGHAHANLAEILVRNGQPTRALREAELALTIYARSEGGHANVPRTRFTRARARYAVGGRRAGRCEATQILADSPNARLAAEVQAWLRTTA